MPDSNQVVRYGRGEMLQHEGTAAEAITAGNLVERAAGGDIQNHSTDGARGMQILVAVDDRDRGMEFGDTYTAGDDATKFLACSGGGVHLRLAAGEAVTEGAPLVPAAGGPVRESAVDGTTGEYTELGAVVAVAAEAIDNSAGTEPAQIAVDVSH